ncbi:MAG: hypothetical protein AAGB12_16630 [Pseudomonadota bacterium]
MVKEEDKSKRKRGAQPGHVGKSRHLLPSDVMDRIIPCYPPEDCSSCGGNVKVGKLRQRNQRISLVNHRPFFTEYQLYGGQCQSCKQRSRASLPEGITLGLLDASFLAVIATLTDKYHLSKAMVTSLIYDFYGLNLSVGTVYNSEHIVSNAIAAPANSIGKAIQKAFHVNLDDDLSPNN